MTPSRILLISRDAGVVGLVETLVRRVGRFGVAVVGGLDEAYGFDGWERVALVLVHHDGRESTNGVARLFRMLAAARRPVATIILGDGLDETIEAGLIRRGAAEVLPRPFEPNRLSYLIEVLTLRSRRAEIERDLGDGPVAWDESDPMVAQARRVSQQDATILIRGEPGTGKSRLARIIHDLSPRRSGRFLSLRCGSLTDESFDDAPDAVPPDPSSVAARLAEARDGTVVLDDVDTLSPAAQVALLRWIEEGSRAALLSPADRPPRPRLVAATRVTLGDEVTYGRFRSDLFYRLNVIGLEIPPLRQRRVEIVSLALAALAELSGRSVTLSPEAIVALESYGWPGNVRELRQVMEASLAADPGERSLIDRECLPETVRTSAGWSGPAAEPETETGTLAQTKRDAEFVRITQALQKNSNNRLRTASELGISRMTLYKKLYKYGIIEPAGGDEKSRARSRPTRAEASADPDDPGRDGGNAGGGRARAGKSAPALH